MTGIHILKTIDKDKLIRKQRKAIKQSDRDGITSKGYKSKFETIINHESLITPEDIWAKDLFI